MEFHIFHKFFFFFFFLVRYFSKILILNHIAREDPWGIFSLSLSLSLSYQLFIYKWTLLHVFIEMGSLPCFCNERVKT